MHIAVCKAFYVPHFSFFPKFIRQRTDKYSTGAHGQGSCNTLLYKSPRMVCKGIRKALRISFLFFVNQGGEAEARD